MQVTDNILSIKILNARCLNKIRVINTRVVFVRTPRRLFRMLVASEVTVRRVGRKEHKSTSSGISVGSAAGGWRGGLTDRP